MPCHGHIQKRRRLREISPKKRGACVCSYGTEEYRRAPAAPRKLGEADGGREIGERQFVTYDEETNRAVFFNTKKEMDRYFEIKVRMLLQDLERLKYFPAPEFWGTIGDIENRIEKLERLAVDLKTKK